MSELIQWPCAKYWDKAWNPIIGCKPCSPACENCYAAAMMRRFGAADFSPRTTTRVNPPRSGVVFCGNMTDLFGEWEYSPSRFYVDIVSKKSNATYLWLTKRVSRMCDAVCEMSICADWRRALNSNHYFGFTAENQMWFDTRTEAAAELPNWANMWISAEPLLGPIDLEILYDESFDNLKWVVVGCESGPKRRPCKIEWVESIVEQCLDAGVRVFVKQICLPDGRFVNTLLDFPKHLRIRQVPWAMKGETKK